MDLTAGLQIQLKQSLIGRVLSPDQTQCFAIVVGFRRGGDPGVYC